MLQPVSARRIFEQRDRRRKRNALFGIGKELATQIDSGQQRLRIQAEMRGDFQVVRQHCGSHQRAHCVVPKIVRAMAQSMERILRDPLSAG